jgi:hypothetical protein
MSKEDDRHPYCPLVEENIAPFVCMENRDMKEEFIPDKFKKKNNWKSICEKCKYHDY